MTSSLAFNKFARNKFGPGKKRIFAEFVFPISMVNARTVPHVLRMKSSGNYQSSSGSFQGLLMATGYNKNVQYKQ